MKNAKLYKERRYKHENNYQLDNYIHYNNGCFYPSYYMTSNDAKNLRAFYKSLIENSNGFILDGFNTRAVIIKDNNDTQVLYSYDMPVCCYNTKTGFKKLWFGYSNTSLKHINIFRQFLGLKSLTKYDWIMMD